MTRERPILFSEPEVRAILEGRKTQHRFPLKPQPKLITRWGGYKFIEHPDAIGEFSEDLFGPCFSKLAKCPQGQPGDRIWVRETFLYDGPYDPKERKPEDLLYRADNIPGRENYVWSPSVHMPRWASRITLEIISVRVERLQEISEGDAKAEGVTPVEIDATDLQGKPVPPDHTLAFIWFWDSRAKPGLTFADKPWVWVTEFRRIP